MSIGRRITDLEQVLTVSNGANYLVETAGGTMRIRQDDLAKVIAKILSLGNLSDLMTEDKESFVSAINEVKQTSANTFVGTNGTVPGKAGMVPGPTAKEEGYFLSSSGIWEPIAAKNLKFQDGKNAEEKLGFIDGISDDLNSENPRIAASSVAVKKLNDGLKWKLLWENQNPSNGNPGNINLLSSDNDYDALVLFHTTYGNQGGLSGALKGRVIRMCSVGNSSGGTGGIMRVFSRVDDITYHIDNAYVYPGESINNIHMIPLKLYGIKL